MTEDILSKWEAEEIENIIELWKIEPQRAQIITFNDIAWLISELKKSWEREKVMREALERYSNNFLGDSPTLDPIKLLAQRALAKVEEMEK